MLLRSIWESELPFTLNIIQKIKMEIFCRWWQLKPALYPERLDFASNSNLRWCRWWWYIGMLMLISACWCWFCWSTVTLKYYSLGLVHLLGFFLFLKRSFNLTFPSLRIGFVFCFQPGALYRTRLPRRSEQPPTKELGFGIFGWKFDFHLRRIECDLWFVVKLALH